MKVRFVGTVQREATKAFPVALGVTGGAVATGVATGLVRKVGPFSVPGLVYDYGAPVVAALAGLLLAFGVSRVKAVSKYSSFVGGLYAGPLAALLMHVGAKLGVRGFQTNTGTAGVGILVAEETAPLEAIVAEAEANGFALAALDDGTLAEIVVEGGAQGTSDLMGDQSEDDDDDEDGAEGMGSDLDVSSGGVGAVDVSSGGVGGFAGNSGWGAW